MKLTKSQLKVLIKEELQILMVENPPLPITAPTAEIKTPEQRIQALEDCVYRRKGCPAWQGKQDL